MLINRFALFSSVSMSGTSELNNIGIVAAWSVRRLFLNYTGPLVRVRRGSDGAEQDFSADSNGELDTDALVNWVGAANDGYVVRWYDQSGGNYHAEQATQARQPQIVDSGTVLLEGGKPKLDFGNYRAAMSVTNNMHARLHAINIPMATFSVQTMVDMTRDYNIMLDIRRLNSSDSVFIGPYRVAGKIYVTRRAPGSGAVNYASELGFPLAQSLAAYLFDGTDATIYSNRTAATTRSNYTFPGTPDYEVADLGGFHHPSNGQSPSFHGSMQEFVLYNVDKAADRTAITDNMMGYYGIS